MSSLGEVEAVQEKKETDVEKSIEETEQNEVAKNYDLEKEGGYGWVVVFAVFFVHVFVLGNFYSFGVFYPVYVDYFNGGAASIAWIGSIGACLMCGIGVYTGKLADYYGNNVMVFVGGILIGLGYLLASFSTAVWHLYLTQGLITGVGYSCSFIGGVSVVGPWFNKNRGLAVGIAVAGSGLGQFAISLITGSLITSYGWRGALQLLALIEVVGLTICALLIKRRTPLSTTWASKGESSLNYFKDKNFSLLFFGGLLVSLGYLVPFTYLPAYSEQYGISTSNSVFIVSMIGVSSAVGRISTGFLADRFGKLQMLQLCYLGSGVATLCWLLTWTFTDILVMGLFFGFFCGGVISLMPSVAAEMYGVDKLASILGLLYSCTAVGNLLSAPIAGFLLQAYSSYGPAIICAACFQLSSLFLVVFIQLKPKSTVAIEGNQEQQEVVINDPEKGITPDVSSEEQEIQKQKKLAEEHQKEYELVTYAEEFEL